MAVEVEKLIVVLEARTAAMTQQMAKGQADINRKLGEIERRFAQTSNKVRQSAVSMGAVLGSIGAYLSVDQLIGYANAWTRVTRSIEAGGDVFGISLKSAEELTQLANDARIDVEAYTKTFIRTSAAIRDYGMGADVAAEVTSTLAKALKLGSASASEQASTILQFSQALQKGKLDGDEFRTVMENAGVIQELLAKRLNVTKGKIVEMAAAGKLQLLDLVGAMRDGKEQIDAIFNLQPTTIDEGFTVLNNSITQFVGHLDQTYEISKSVANALAFLSQNIDTVGKVALVAGIGLLAMFAPAILAGVVALGAGAAAAAGPFGLLIGAIGAGSAAISLFGDQAGVLEGGLVSLKSVVEALTLEFRDSMDTADEATRRYEANAARLAAMRRSALLARSGAATAAAEADASRLDFAGDEFDKIANESLTDRVRRRAKEIELGRGFTERAQFDKDGKLIRGTNVDKVRPDHKIETPVDAEAERARKRFAKDLLEAENRIDLARQEKEAIGRSSYEVEQMRVRQQLLNEARKAGVTLTGADLAQIEQLADATARAVTEAETLRNAYEDLKSESKEFLSGFITDLKDGEGATQALANALDRVSNRLIDMAVENLVESALGGLTGRGGNATGSSGGSALLGLFGFAKGGIAANGRPVALPRFANGGVSRSAAIFGEAGPEAAVPLPDGRRIPVDLNVPSAKAGGGATQIVMPVTFNVQNGSPEGVDKLKTEIVPLMKKVAQAEIAQTFERKDKFRRGS